MSTVTDEPYWHMSFKCPHCAAKGMIPWDRLKADRRLHCRRCAHWYRVSRQGKLLPAAEPEKKITVSVRSSFSDWMQYQRNAKFGRHAMTDPRFWRDLAMAIVVSLLAARTGMRATVLATAIILMFAVGWLLRSQPSVAVAPSEPTTLAERAPIFARAWACSDFATMMHYTLGGESDQLKDWAVAMKRPPSLLDAESDEVMATAVSVVPQQDPHQAVATLRIAGRAPAEKQVDAASDYQQREMWIEQDGQWFFSPKETIAKLAPAAGTSIDPRNFVPVSPRSRH